MNESPTHRFVDQKADLLSFMDEYAVECPRCQKCARVAVVDSNVQPLFAPRRLTCTNCGHADEWQGSGVSSGFSRDPRDWYFQLKFYFRVLCCGHELWVLNRRHLQYLREFVGAKIRARSQNEHGWSNRTLASRMPKWLSAASHRQEILAALTQIEKLMDANEGVIRRSPSKK